MASRGYIFMFLFCAVLAGCTGESLLGEAALKQWIADPEHGVLVADRQEFVVTTLQYRPVDLVISQELRGMDYRAEDVARLRKDYDSLDFFVMKISKRGQEIENMFAQDPAAFAEVISYLNGDIADDIWLNVGNKPVLPEQVAYVRTFGAATASSLMIVFKSGILKQDADIVCTWEDTKMHTGIHRFAFTLKNIKDIPKLKL